MPQQPAKSPANITQSQTPPKSDPKDQSWFWTPEWQAEEEAASREIEDGELSPPFDNVDDAAEWLDSSE